MGLQSKTAGPVEQAQAKPGSRMIRIGLVVAVVAVGIVLYSNYVRPPVNSVIKLQPVVSDPVVYDSTFVEMTNIPVRVDGDDLVFPLSILKEAKLVRFPYKARTTDRFLMAYLSPDGRLVTAISLSDHCGSTEFKIKDNKIYCAHCPSNWDMMTMEAYACCGMFYPDPIPSRVEGEEVRISKEVVERWAGRL